MQKIKINIANRTYPLSVEENQEETIRKSAKKINDAMSEGLNKSSLMNFRIKSTLDLIFVELI